jgi:cysteinyl-tRNA synthetase
MSLQIYNTLARKKEQFTPMEAGKIKMYVCGMTVYDYCHLGHARVLVAFDVIVRYLRSQGYDVTYVRNITDIDDKILTRADENGEVFSDLTERFITAMHEDEARLGVARPTMEPRATSHLGDIITMVETLIEKGFAYPADNGDVYYSVAKFDGYGKLSGKNPDELLAGARIAVGDVKKDPRDFALWKSASEGEVSWQSPWGDGRPGWHIECSAMSKCCLGDSFDIHGGGPDLPFPHHENEIAQSEAANGVSFANAWMHAGAVRVDGEKMSKSLGNFFTIREILAKYHPEVVRFLLLASHYRSAINYSEDNLKEAKIKLDRFYQALKDYAEVAATDITELAENAYYQRFVAAMNDDFATPEAIAVMFELVRDINSNKTTAAENIGVLKTIGGILGVLQGDPLEYLQGTSQSDGPSVEDIENAIQKRLDARANKDFALADQIRDEMKAAGVVLEDVRDKESKQVITTWRRE